MQFWGEHQDVFRTMQQYLRKCKKLAPIHLEPPSWRGLVTGIVLALFTYNTFASTERAFATFTFEEGASITFNLKEVDVLIPGTFEHVFR